MATIPEPPPFISGEKITLSRMNGIIEYITILRRMVEAMQTQSASPVGVDPVWFNLGSPISDSVAGQYDATTYDGDPNYDEADDIGSDDLGSTGDSPNAIAWNLWETTNGSAGKSVLQPGGDYPGFAVGPTSNGKTLILFIWEPDFEVTVDLKWSVGDGGTDGDCSKNPTWAYGFTAPDGWKTDDHGGAIVPQFDYEPGFGSYSKASRGRIARKSDGSWEILYTNTQLVVNSDCCGTPPP